MERKLIAVTAALLLAGALVTAQSQTTPPAAQEPVKDVTLTGCLIQGSAPDVFILDKAKKDTDERDEETFTYVVTTDNKDLNLRTHVNHRVKLVGTIEKLPNPNVGGDDTRPPVKPLDEKMLPRFKSKTVIVVSDTCSIS